jgi:hypothetical protein
MPVKGGAGEILEPVDDTAGNMSLRDLDPAAPTTENGSGDDTEGDPAKFPI